MATVESVLVGVRVRPFNDREKSLGAELCIKMNGPNTAITDKEQKDTVFVFDDSLWSHDGFITDEKGYMHPDGPNSRYADQKYCFKKFGQRVLDNAWAGYHCCLFAYGQTGSGKSYSMVGYGANKGIVPISCNEIFARIGNNTNENLKYEVTVSMVEIYNECVQDLMMKPDDRPRKGLEIRENKMLGVYIDGVIKSAVNSFESIEKVIDDATANRTVGATLMNATSSRAHTVLTIEFRQMEQMEGGRKSDKVSMINLVDLAGSEKAGQTGATGDRLKEGSAINKSLSALGNVIEKLAARSGMAPAKAKNVIIPYRDSKLTRLLQNALGGNSKTIMICALSPASSNYEETYSTLRYADRAKKIKNIASTNENPEDKLLRELREENDKLKELWQAAQMSGQVEDLKKVNDMQEEIKNTEERLKELQRDFEEKLAEVESKRAQDRKREERNALGARRSVTIFRPRGGEHDVPHLVNLNEDPYLTGKLRHMLHEDTPVLFVNPSGRSCDPFWTDDTGKVDNDEEIATRADEVESDKESDSGSSIQSNYTMHLLLDGDENPGTIHLHSEGVFSTHAKLINRDGNVFLYAYGLAAEATYVNGETINVLVPRMLRRREVEREEALARARDDYSYEAMLAAVTTHLEHDVNCTLALEKELHAALELDDFRAAEFVEDADYEAQREMESDKGPDRPEQQWFESDGEEEAADDVQDSPEGEAVEGGEEAVEDKPEEDKKEEQEEILVEKVEKKITEKKGSVTEGKAPATAKKPTSKKDPSKKGKKKEPKKPTSKKPKKKQEQEEPPKSVRKEKELVRSVKTDEEKKAKFVRHVRDTVAHSLERNLRMAVSVDVGGVRGLRKLISSKFDVDKSGALNAKEMSRLIRLELHIPEQRISDDDIEALVLGLDFDDSGEISVDELVDLVELGAARFVGEEKPEPIEDPKEAVHPPDGSKENLGKERLEGIPLEHGDRVAFGKNFFVFCSPFVGSTDLLLLSGSITYGLAREEQQRLEIPPARKKLQFLGARGLGQLALLAGVPESESSHGSDEEDEPKVEEEAVDKHMWHTIYRASMDEMKAVEVLLLSYRREASKALRRCEKAAASSPLDGPDEDDERSRKELEESAKTVVTKVNTAAQAGKQCNEVIKAFIAATKNKTKTSAKAVNAQVEHIAQMEVERLKAVILALETWQTLTKFIELPDEEEETNIFFDALKKVLDAAKSRQESLVSKSDTLNRAEPTSPSHGANMGRMPSIASDMGRIPSMALADDADETLLENKTPAAYELEHMQELKPILEVDCQYLQAVLASQSALEVVLQERFGPELPDRQDLLQAKSVCEGVLKQAEARIEALTAREAEFEALVHAEQEELELRIQIDALVSTQGNDHEDLPDLLTQLEEAKKDLAIKKFDMRKGNDGGDKKTWDPFGLEGFLLKVAETGDKSVAWEAVKKLRMSPDPGKLRDALLLERALLLENTALTAKNATLVAKNVDADLGIEADSVSRAYMDKLALDSTSSTVCLHCNRMNGIGDDSIGLRPATNEEVLKCKVNKMKEERKENDKKLIELRRELREKSRLNEEQARYMARDELGRCVVTRFEDTFDAIESAEVASIALARQKAGLSRKVVTQRSTLMPASHRHTSQSSSLKRANSQITRIEEGERSPPDEEISEVPEVTPGTMAVGRWR